MKNWIKEHKKAFIAICVVVALVVVGIVASLTKDDTVENTQTTAAVEQRTLMESVSATGKIMASDEVEVTSEASGVDVTAVYVEAGDTVSIGQVIAILDSTDLQEDLADARETLTDEQEDDAKSRADAEQDLADAATTRDEDLQDITDDINTAQSDYDYAKSTYENSLALYNNSKASLGENDATTITYNSQMLEDKQAMESAETKLNNLKNSEQSDRQRVYDTYNDAVEQYNDTIENLDDGDTTAQDNVTDLENQIADCVVKATVSGLITSVGVEVGDEYSGGTIAVIDNVDNFDVETEIDEYDINDIEVGQEVVVKTNVTGDDELTGVVTKVAKVATDATTVSGGSSSSMGSSGLNLDLSSLTSSSSLTGSSSSSDDVTFTVTISITSQDERLRIGMTAKLSIVTEKSENVISVPYNAVMTDDDGATYYVEKITGTDEETGEYTTQKITIIKGIESDYYTEVKGAELVVGDQVLLPETEAGNSLEDMINSSSSMGGVE